MTDDINEPLDAPAFLLDLAERLRRIPVMHGVDEGDISKLGEVIDLLKGNAEAARQRSIAHVGTVEHSGAFLVRAENAERELRKLVLAWDAMQSGARNQQRHVKEWLDEALAREMAAARALLGTAATPHLRDTSAPLDSGKAEAKLKEAHAVLNRIKLRLHFMGWPAESYWNSGTEEKPHWRPDWRHEIALIENALHGSPIRHFERPTDTKPRNLLVLPGETLCNEALAEAKTFRKRFRALRNLCGFVANGSETTVTIFQDDATRTFHIAAGKQHFHGNSLEDALDTVAREGSEGG
jgi:hypothetical protein